MTSDPRYGDGWQDLRRREFFFWVVLLTFIPGLMAISLVLDAWQPGHVRPVVPAFALDRRACRCGNPSRAVSLPTLPVSFLLA
jgi:hypothetical protein